MQMDFVPVGSPEYSRLGTRRAESEIILLD